MKKILTTAIICAGVCCLTACSDFLDEVPKSQLTSADYYKTEAQALANINYLYRTGAMGQIGSAGSAYVGCFSTVTGMLTGYFSNNYEGQEVICRYSRELTRQQYAMQISGTMDGVWDNCFRAINVANGAILNIPNIPMSEATAAKYVAEAKFFRAFGYYFLVKTFGAVPFYTEPYERAENMELERTDPTAIYAQIETDLKEAVNVLPAQTFAANSHRITKYAAAMMLTAVYMQQGKYADAAQYARIVIDSPHGLTTNGDLEMNSAFNKLRSIDDLDESIYAIEYDGTIDWSDWFPTYAFNASAASSGLFSTYSIFESVYGVTDQFLNIYETNDLRIQPNQFFHWNYTNPENGLTWTSEEAGNWYYYDEDALLNTGHGTKDWNIFRYAEALLDAAEAIAQSEGVTAEAAGYLAQVQARANMEGKTVAAFTSELQGLSKQAFIEACWTERLREFPLEYKIWDDCLRTGKFPVISTTDPGKVTYVDLVGARNGSGATFKESDLLWPISVNELQRNSKLEQNPGYN
ncbi:MAG: RagB/SusD family nutrient uptake outer membrane protein [Tannerellaceae bacterium]|jgi:hypothetical protein|nr:RagB/SusD family nutrient uptake outer membrane protein [Tannerellaceae bacterium]